MNLSIAATIASLSFAAALATQPAPKPAFVLADSPPSISTSELMLSIKTELPVLAAEKHGF